MVLKGLLQNFPTSHGHWALKLLQKMDISRFGVTSQKPL